MTAYEITINLEQIIAESREVAQALNEFADNLERIEKKYAEPQENGKSDNTTNKSILIINTPKTCGDCPLCIFSADEKRHIGFCNTSDEDYYCKILDRFMEYDRVDGGIDILGKPTDCPLKTKSEE